MAPFSDATQLLPITPPFIINIPGPIELFTIKLLITAGPFEPQLTLLKNNPARSLIGAEKDVCPLFKKVAFSILVEESVIYALSPTAILSSITAPSIWTPLVLISNAAYPNPEVFAFGPPVPLSSKFSKMAFVSKFEY